MGRSLLFIILLVAGIAVFTAGCIKPQDGSDTMTFEKSIINDAKARYPDANIVEIEGSEMSAGVNMTNVRVSFGIGTICPSRMRLRYKNTFGYETGVPTYIVKDCEYKCEGNCIITGEEEAIIAAHKLPGTEQVQAYIGDGTGIKTSAVYSAEFGTWLVTFSRQSDGSKMVVKLTSMNPAVLQIEME
jgi:hypothetical protein